MNTNPLFSEFTPVSAKQWKQKIQYDLRGADYNETLVWESLEGVHIKPFYHPEDSEKDTAYQLPDRPGWEVGQNILCTTAETANKKALDILDRGATALVVELHDPDVDWSVLLQGIDLAKVTIHLDAHFLDKKAFQGLFQTIKDTPSKIYLNIDPLGHLARSGNWFVNQDTDFEDLGEVLGMQGEHSSTHVLSVDTTVYQNAGANIIQQLAYGLAHANEYLNRHSAAGLSSSSGNLAVTFKVAIGGNYFFEIAKIKTLRWLWETLATSYGLPGNCHILASPSKRNKTLYDYNVNLLRTTSECMAAVLGGADTIFNLPYDALYHEDNEFGDRIARNQLLLLKEESYFDEAATAAEGSYYIDALTRQFAEKGLELFKQLEASGGFLQALKNNIIQKKIKESDAKEQALFDQGDLVLLGTNTYQNPEDTMKQQLERSPFPTTNTRKTLIAPIVAKRLAAAMEQKRLANE